MKKKPEESNEYIKNRSEVAYMTRKESATYLRISLAKFDQIKDIAKIRYGKSVRFDLRALQAYAERHTISVEGSTE